MSEIEFCIFLLGLFLYSFRLAGFWFRFRCHRSVTVINFVILLKKILPSDMNLGFCLIPSRSSKWSSRKKLTLNEEVRIGFEKKKDYEFRYFCWHQDLGEQTLKINFIYFLNWQKFLHFTSKIVSTGGKLN
jgi:hypothetical protein